MNSKKSLTASLSAFGSAMLLGLSACGGGSDQTQGQAPAIPVRLQTVERGPVIDSSEFVGTLEAQQRVALAPQIDGRILNILRREGDRVSTGELLVQLQPLKQQEEVNSAQAAVQSQIASLRQAEADLISTQASLIGARAELRAAQADEARAGADVERAKADLQDIVAEVELAEINIERNQMLVEGGALPQQDLDDATRDLKTNQAQQSARQKAVDAAAQSQAAAAEGIEQARATITQQEAAIERQQAEIAKQKAEIERARGQLGSVSEDLDYNSVRAPIDGILGAFPVKVGDYVNIGDEITTLTRNKQLDINIFVPIEYRDQLQVGLPVDIINRDGSQGTRGNIYYVAPRVDQTSQAVLAKATFVNDGSLRDNQFVKVRVVWNEQPGVLIPTVSLRLIGGQNFVFVAESGDESGQFAKQKPVTLGKIQGQNYHATSGVQAGEKIVVSGILGLRDGIPITTEIPEQSLKPSN
ncbi:MAG: efflux RND transporter periplasmic adaptor subunit [Cyanobacteria bacterium P01_H01_bin.15]